MSPGPSEQTQRTAAASQTAVTPSTPSQGFNSSYSFSAPPGAAISIRYEMTHPYRITDELNLKGDTVAREIGGLKVSKAGTSSGDYQVQFNAGFRGKVHVEINGERHTISPSGALLPENPTQRQQQESTVRIPKPQQQPQQPQQQPSQQQSRPPETKPQSVKNEDQILIATHGQAAHPIRRADDPATFDRMKQHLGEDKYIALTGSRVINGVTEYTYNIYNKNDRTKPLTDPIVMRRTDGNGYYAERNELLATALERISSGSGPLPSVKIGSGGSEATFYAATRPQTVETIKRAHEAGVQPVTQMRADGSMEVWLYNSAMKKFAPFKAVISASDLSTPQKADAAFARAVAPLAERASHKYEFAIVEYPNTSPEFRAAVRADIAALPTEFTDFLVDRGYSFHVQRTATQVERGLTGTPSGYPKEATYDSARGLAFSKTKNLVITEKYVSLKTGKLEDTMSTVTDVVAHEAGHALAYELKNRNPRGSEGLPAERARLDRSQGRVATIDSVFSEFYLRDINQLQIAELDAAATVNLEQGASASPEVKDSGRKSLSYYLMSGRDTDSKRAMAECFAESVMIALRGARTERQQKFSRVFSHSIEMVSDILVHEVGVKPEAIKRPKPKDEA